MVDELDVDTGKGSPPAGSSPAKGEPGQPPSGGDNPVSTGTQGGQPGARAYQRVPDYRFAKVIADSQTVRDENSQLHGKIGELERLLQARGITSEEPGEAVTFEENPELFIRSQADRSVAASEKTQAMLEGRNAQDESKEKWQGLQDRCEQALKDHPIPDGAYAKLVETAYWMEAIASKGKVDADSFFEGWSRTIAEEADPNAGARKRRAALHGKPRGENEPVPEVIAKEAARRKKLHHRDRLNEALGGARKSATDRWDAATKALAGM